MNNIWHDLDARRVSPEDFICVVEISKGSKKKYELDKETGYIILDRVLYTSTHYPANYGFIPKTLGSDRDPLDVLVICEDKLNPLSLVKCHPVGAIKMLDNNEIDEKIVAVADNDPLLGQCRDVSQLPSHQFNRIRHFFEVYKYLEGKQTEVGDILPVSEAKSIIADCLKNYQSKFG